MGILRKPYEISVWEDEWNSSTGKFDEKKICVIGTDTMESQSRVLEPTFTQNVNGVKKLTFKLYKKYIDNITGEKVDNVFAQLLTSERKVKLYYKEKWHDFIVKNVDQTTSNYLYSYQLEDALVQELSKNGYDVTLDEKLQNNLGTAAQLASTALEGSGWTVSADSEKFVQKIEEALVYVKVKPGSVLKAYHILDQSNTNFSAGVTIEQNTAGTTPLEIQFDNEEILLGFYSSCTEKPHRFQFIFVENLANLTRDEKRIIINANCQYYADFVNPSDNYYNVEGFYLPKELELSAQDETEADGSVTENVKLSGRYRGARYGFGHQGKYIPELDRYVNFFNGPSYEYPGKDEQGNDTTLSSTLYYGFEESEYISPTTIVNLVSSPDFSSRAGWVGTRNSNSTESKKAEIEPVYGRFTENGVFKSCIEDVQAGVYNTFKDKTEEQGGYKPYLKMTFHDSNSLVINSGPFDRRATMGNMAVGELMAMKYKCLGPYTGTEAVPECTNLEIKIGEYIYDPDQDCYAPRSSNNAGITFSDFSPSETAHPGYYFSQVLTNTYSETIFKKQSKLRICISCNTPGVYYLENLAMFKSKTHLGALVTPDTQGETLTEGIVQKKYTYFRPIDLTNVTKRDDLVPVDQFNVLTYSTYAPIYNEGAEKTRTVSAQESNYFNILQSIAETFEAWLVLEVTRDSSTGAVLQKKVKFKNYAGGDNHAGFRYGVNLKDIQRTDESKNIVTKLIVKPNNNQYGTDGFCSIQRSNLNPTGENCLYDFQYYFSQDLLSESDFNGLVYATTGGIGKDLNPNHDETVTPTNLIGYYPRLKNINQQLIEKNSLLINKKTDLTKFKAKLEVAEAGLEAAQSGIEDVRERFLEQFKKPMDGYFADSTLEVSIKANSDSQNIVTGITGNTSFEDDKWIFTGSLVRNFSISNAEGRVTIVLTQKFIDYDPVIKEYEIEYAFLAGVLYCNISFEFTPDLSDLSSVQSLYQELSNYYKAKRTHTLNKLLYESFVTNYQIACDDLESTIDSLKEQKTVLNNLFFNRYSRFIQEGTWMDEKYYDDNLYYADAQSVLYNSCFPQVAYNINVVALSALPGYESFEFNPGEKTYVEDPEFFGSLGNQEVIIAELSENLDDPNKDSIKVQNFKDQFQDLFQRITATVQQTQYSTGAYEKAVALTESTPEARLGFLNGALENAEAVLAAAGQQSVLWSNSGLTIQSTEAPSNAIRMVGGAILLSKQDENGEQRWVTGMTTEGISASLVTAGTINTGTINIMNGSDPAFMWNQFGISAFDNETSAKFVRFDKHGLYGINSVDGVDGKVWTPVENAAQEIDSKATFALTWEGMKVTGNENVVARMGKQGGNIFTVTKKQGDQTVQTFSIDNDGSVTTTGLKIKQGVIVNNDGTVSEGLEDYVQNTADVAAGTAEQNAKDHAQKIAEDMAIVFDGKLSTSTATLTGLIESLQQQIDGSIDTYFLPYLPDVGAYPVVDEEVDGETTKVGWQGDYIGHNGDLFYVISPGGVVYTQTDVPSSPSKDDYWVHPDAESQVTVVDKYTVPEDGDPSWVRLDPQDSETEIAIVMKVGYCYRWQYADEDNSDQPTNSNWVIVTDTAVAEALAAAARAQATADGKATVFYTADNVLPPAPYSVGDLWVNATYSGSVEVGEGGEETVTVTYNKEILWCIESTNAVGTESILHWSRASEYADNLLNNFITKDFDPYKNDIKNQIDQKSEIFHINSDPADYSEGGAWGAEHVGDLWRCTGSIKSPTSTKDDTEVTRNTNSEWVWKEIGEGYGWSLIDIPDNIVAAYDGKATLFVSKPTAYQINDLWILEKQGMNSEGDNYGENYPPYPTGTLVVATNINKVINESGYSKDHWVEKTRYTDDTTALSLQTELQSFQDSYNTFTQDIQNQVDGKAETWYQSNDPATSWTDDDTKNKHLGDLWCDTDDGKEYIYKYVDNEYDWHEMSVPDELFDEIDAKSTIYVTLQVAEGQDSPEYTVGDLLIPASNEGDYKAGKVYKYNGSSWVEIAYTDDTALEQMEIGGANLFIASTFTDEDWNSVIDPSRDGYEFSGIIRDSGGGGLGFSKDLFTIDKNYIFTCKFKRLLLDEDEKTDDEKTNNKESTLQSIGGHATAYQTNRFLIDGNLKASNTTGTIEIPVSDDGNEHFVEWHVQRQHGNDNPNLYFQFNRTNNSVIKFKVWDIQIEQGTKKTAWKPAREDIEYQISVLEEEIKNIDVSFDDTEITGKINALNANVKEWLGLGAGTMLDKDKVISPYIGGGYLNITSTDNGARVVIDPNNISDNPAIFQVYNEAGEMSIGLGADGNAKFVGEIEARSGKIGTMEIDDVTRNSVGRNLIIGSGKYSQTTPYVLTPDSYDCYRYLTDMTFDVVSNQTYTISCETDGYWAKHVSNSSTGSEKNKHCTLWIASYPNHASHWSFEGNGSETGRKSWTFTASSTEKLTIRVNTYGVGNDSVSFWNFKIEKGTTATDWSVPPEEAMVSNANGTYSWKFSPIDGITMWRGPQSDLNKIFKVDSNGITLDGNIHLNGNITWGASANPIRVLYNRSGSTTPSGNYDSFPANYDANNRGGWHKTFDSANDKYTSYSYDGGVTWNTPMKTVGTDGSGATVTRDAMLAALSDATEQDGIYNFNGNIGIRASAIKTGALQIGELFYANVGSPNVKIGGWNVDSNAIYAGTLGSEGSMWLVRDGSATSAEFGDLGQMAGWCIAVGRNFAVHKDGSIYSAKGVVGGVNIAGSNNKGNGLVEAMQGYAASAVATADANTAKYLQAGGESIVDPNYVISPYIGGGYLNITDNIKRVVIDPKGKTNTGYIFAVMTNLATGTFVEGTSKITVGIKDNGEATFSGNIYATGGEIGGMTIGDLVAGASDTARGDNLASGNAVGVFAGTITKSADYKYTISGDSVYTGLSIGSDKCIFERGKKYIINYKYKVTSGNSSLAKISGHATGFEILSAIVDGVQQTSLPASGNAYDFSIDTTQSEHSVQLEVQYIGSFVAGSTSGIYVQPLRSYTVQNIAFEVWDVEAKEMLNSDGAYSWQFSPTQGIKMWNGAQSLNTEIFRVDSSGLYVAGTVNAISGYIGDWTLSKNTGTGQTGSRLTSGEFGAEGSVHLYTAYYGSADTQIAGHGDASWRLTIGNNFGVNNQGVLYANGAQISGRIEATSGTIGGFNLGRYTMASGEAFTYDSNGNINENGQSSVVGMCSESGHGPWAIWAGGGGFGDKPFRVGHGGELYATNAHITGEITATKLTLGSGTKISTDNIDGIANYATTASLSNYATTASLKNYLQTNALNDYYKKTEVSTLLAGYATNGELSKYLQTSNLSAQLGTLKVAYQGDVTTTSVTDETTGIITTTSTYKDANGNTQTTTMYTTESSNYVLLSRDSTWGDGSLCKISKDGLLEANNAVIYGKIVSGEGSIGGWQIDTNKITSGGVTLSSTSGIGQKRIYTTSVSDEIVSRKISFMKSYKGSDFTKAPGIRHKTIPFKEFETDLQEFTSFSAGNSYVTNIASNNNKFPFSSFIFDTEGIKVTVLQEFSDDETIMVCIAGYLNGKAKVEKFVVLDDGTVQAIGAEFQGSVSASTGSIGGWLISDSGLYYKDTTPRHYYGTDLYGREVDSSGYLETFISTTDGIYYRVGTITFRTIRQQAPSDGIGAGSIGSGGLGKNPDDVVAGIK